MKVPLAEVEEVLKQEDFLEHNGVILIKKTLDAFSTGTQIKKEIAKILLHENVQIIDKESIKSVYGKYINSSINSTTQEILDIMIKDQQSTIEINTLPPQTIMHPASKPLLTGTNA